MLIWKKTPMEIFGFTEIDLGRIDKDEVRRRIKRKKY